MRSGVTRLGGAVGGPRRRWRAMLGLVGAVVVLAGCSQGGQPAKKKAGPVPAAVISTTVAGDTGVSPAAPVSVKVSGGTLSSVRITNAAGKQVAGQFAGDKKSWRATEKLGYGKTYTLTATGANAKGKPASKTQSFSTLTPGSVTMPYLQRIGGYALQNGATYGVGIVPVVHFDEHITDKRAAEQALTVTTTPHVDGSWYWSDDENVHWRPQNYYAAGTKVTVSANVYGVQVGKNMYGQSDVSASFTIGAKHVAVADDHTHQVYVYTDDKLVRTMPTSMGRGGYVQGKTGKISLWTMSGQYTVLEHQNPAIMSSDSYGLSSKSPNGYPAEPVYWSTKISTDGIYLHQLDDTVSEQGHSDVSHGCLNLNHDNAQWYYNYSLIGDVVEVRYTTGPSIAVWQGGDWSVPWATWTAGSALH